MLLQKFLQHAALGLGPFLLVVQPAESTQPLSELATMQTRAPRVANPEPAGTFAMPVSALRFEPLVDLQSRNLAEAQGDVSIRGGIFENTGFSLGAATLFDPQTGHYYAEIPASPRMLQPPEIYTGVTNALWGMNSGVGTIDYGWARIHGSSLELEGGLGTDALNTQRVYGSRILGEQASGTWAADFEYARSEGDGTVAGGKHEFERANARVQWQGPRENQRQAQTDLFFGWQEKYFQWPFLYAVKELHELVGSSGIESEDLETLLLQANHKQRIGSEGFVEASAYYRRNRDDYEFDITQPGLFNPYEHETEVTGLAAQSRLPLLDDAKRLDLLLAAHLLADTIDSTSLTFGDFQSRTYWKLAAAPELIFPLAGSWFGTALAGFTYNDSNREPGGDAFSPLARVSLKKTDGPAHTRFYAEYSQATQLPGYTAIAGNPNGGLFRGNQELAREFSRNAEAGVEVRRGPWQVRGALFHRQDKDLVDWVFDSSGSTFASRFARNVAIDTTGLELLGSWEGSRASFTASYTFLEKDEDYAGAPGDASFYALNFPEHRATAAIVLRPREDLELRLDNEFRIQKDNALRQTGDNAFFTHAGLVYRLPIEVEANLQLDVNNLWDENFEEVPGVPGNGRQLTLRLSVRL